MSYFWSRWLLLLNTLKWHKNNDTPGWKLWNGLAVVPHSGSWASSPSLVLIVFLSTKGWKRITGKFSIFWKNYRIPHSRSIAIHLHCVSFQDKCWVRKSTDSSTKGRMLATMWTSQDIFGEKSWNGEWKKDRLRARGTTEKLWASTFGSIPSWVSKLGKKRTFFFPVLCQSFVRHQKLITLFIFKSLWNYERELNEITTVLLSGRGIKHD